MPVIISQLRQSGFCLVSYSTVHTRISGLNCNWLCFLWGDSDCFCVSSLTSNLSFQISNCSLQDPIPSENKIATIRYPAQHWKLSLPSRVNLHPWLHNPHVNTGGKCWQILEKGLENIRKGSEKYWKRVRKIYWKRVRKIMEKGQQNILEKGQKNNGKGSGK